MIVKNNIRKIIKRTCITIGAMIIFLIGELFILSTELAAASVLGGGAVCLIGLVVPFIRNNLIVVDFVSSLQNKLLVMAILGVLFSVGGGFGLKKINSYNIRFCRLFFNKDTMNRLHG